uniref:Uncharacterized protein n=1 Tax=Pyxicephalus adspersus TaxID=30357 RepID=A0AAV3ASK2_PYXAD|nr:TPA: hypothetical protein GDO54_008414 [Pyxicephalus adspersus]
MTPSDEKLLVELRTCFRKQNKNGEVRTTFTITPSDSACWIYVGYTPINLLTLQCLPKASGLYTLYVYIETIKYHGRQYL